MSNLKTVKTAVIYARYSSEQQTEQSIEGQIHVCEDYAKRNGLVIVDTYIDRAMTGTNDNRVAFQKMLKDSAKKNFDVVLVYKLDRFARNRYDSIINRKKLSDNGVEVVSAMENIPITPEGKLFLSIIEGYNEYYSEELRQKVRRGMSESRRKGHYQGGARLYGYQAVNKKLQIVENEAKVVRYVYQQYATGSYPREIVAELNKRGMLIRGRKFVLNHIYNMLYNEKYSGVYHFEGEEFRNIYPQIVPEDIYKMVRKKLNVNRYGRRSQKTKYLLSKIMFCGYCGSKISSESGTPRKGEIARYYKCMGRRAKNGCKKLTVPKDALEELVANTIVTALSNTENLDRIVAGLMQIQKNKAKDNDMLIMYQRELKQTTNSIENIMKLIEQGGATINTVKRLRELEQQQKDLEKSIEIEKLKTETEISEDTIRRFYKRALSLKPEMMIAYFVEKIILYDERMVVYFTTPLPQSPDDNQGFSFYSETTMFGMTENGFKKRALVPFGITVRI